MHILQNMYGIYFRNISKGKYVRLQFFLEVPTKKPLAYTIFQEKLKKTRKYIKVHKGEPRANCYLFLRIIQIFMHTYYREQNA